MRILPVLVWLATAAPLALPGLAQAQSALAAAAVDAHRLPPPALSLRPSPELRTLAEQVAGVLELRTGQRVVVGDAPPPELLEAVPTGHVALALRDGEVLLVLGAPGGRSFETSLRVPGQDVATDARAVALALEALRDEATDLARTGSPTVPVAAAPMPSVAEPELEAPPQSVSVAQLQRPIRDDVEPMEERSRDEFLPAVEPLIYLKAYGGASSASATFMTGLGAGLGLCVRGHCLFIGGELPAQFGNPGLRDVRYRYPTFTSGFYTRPFRFGAFTPGASVGFLTRLGHFDQDMGLGDTGLATDLGARGSLELSWEMFKNFDLMGEGGVDLTIDHHRVSVGDTYADRADRWSPWAQLAIRYRP